MITWAFVRGTILMCLATTATSEAQQPTLHNAMSRKTYVYAPNLTISYEASGHGNRALILLHGFGASLESWNDILPTLETNFRIYRLDLKGHGLSAKPHDANYSLYEQARIVTAFVRQENLQNAVLVGHSYGGAVAIITYLSLAEADLNPITSMILIDSAGYPQTFPFFVSLLRHPILNSIIQNLVPARVRAAHTLRKLFYDPNRINNERIQRYARYFDLPGAHYAFTQCARQILPKDVDAVVAKIPSITARTLIIWGANDPVIPVSTGERLHQEIAGSKIHIIDKCGHIPQEENPAATAAIIEGFLSGA